MPIDFRQASITDPKIDIIGKEVPLAALQSTAGTLQDRFDKSYENETKTQALMKRALQDVALEDLPVAQQAFDTYNQRLQERSKSGDYHNMRWQTLQDAQEFGNIYSGLSERAKKLQQYRDAISTYKGISDPAQKAYELEKWKKAQSAINFDNQNRVLTGLGVSAPSLVDDLDVAKFVDTYGKGFESDITGYSNGNTKMYNAGDKLPNGQPAPISAFYDTKTGKRVEQVKESDIKKGLQKYLDISPDAQAYKGRMEDYYINGLGLTPEQASAKVQKDIFNKGIQAAATKYGFSKILTESDAGIDTAATNTYGKANKPLITGIPVNTLADSYGTPSGSLRETFVKGLKGERGNYHTILNYVNQQINSAADPKTKEQYIGFKNALDKVKNLSAEDQSTIANHFGSIFSGKLGSNTSLLTNHQPAKVVGDINKYIGTAISFDNDIENKFNEYSKGNVGFQNINLLTPHYQDAESINHLQTWMKHSLDAGDFKSFKGEIDPKADYSFSKVSDRPLGNGTGVVIELKNTKDNSTILVEPKDERMLQALEANFPGIASMNMFKNTTDFNLNEARAVKDLLKENGISAKNTPLQLQNSKILYTLDNNKQPVYRLVSPNGQVINESTSYLDLF